MRSQATSPSRPVSPAGPWDVVYMDTLTLGASLDRSCSSVLIRVDALTKWTEVVPLERNDARSVAEAFTAILLTPFCMCGLSFKISSFMNGH